jgi:hypothetical protein
MRKPNISQRDQGRRAQQSSAAAQQGLPHFERGWVTGPTLREILDISPVTLWRWRHDERMGFPTAKCIKGRLYFPLYEVTVWLEQQPRAS